MPHEWGPWFQLVSMRLRLGPNTAFSFATAQGHLNKKDEGCEGRITLQ